MSRGQPRLLVRMGRLYRSETAVIVSLRYRPALMEQTP